MRVAHLDWRSVLVRALRVVYGSVLIAIAVAALAIGGTLTLLQTSWGGRAVARFALARVNATIAGRIGLGRLAFRGTRVTLERLALRDPAGRLVADVERVDVAWSPSALLRRRVAVEALAIRRPRLFLVDDAGELNLARALASRSPTAKRPPPSEPQGKPSRLVIEVRGWEVTGGVVEFQSGGADARRRVRVDDVRIGGTLQLAGDRLALDTTVDLPGGHLELRGVADLSPARGPIALEGRLEARLPGARVTASGVAKDRRVDLRLAVDATDLDATARAVAPVLGAPLPAIAGRGRIDATVTGSDAAPSLRAAADVPALRVGANRIRALTGSVWLPDLGRPEAIDVELHADAATLGGEVLRSPSVALHAVGRRLEARAHVAAPELTLALTGHRHTNPPASRDITLEALTLEYPEARWTLARPARLSLAPGRLGVSGLAVISERQKIEVDLAQTRRGVAGRLVVTALDVARLPRVLAPPALGLAGRLDATVHLGGRAAAPEVDVQAALGGGRNPQGSRHRRAARRADGRRARPRPPRSARARHRARGALRPPLALAAHPSRAHGGGPPARGDGPRPHPASARGRYRRSPPRAARPRPAVGPGLRLGRRASARAFGPGRAARPRGTPARRGRPRGPRRRRSPARGEPGGHRAAERLARALEDDVVDAAVPARALAPPARPPGRSRARPSS